MFHTRPVVYRMPDIEEGEPLTSPDEPVQLQRRAPFDQKLRDTLAPVIKVLHLPSQMEKQESDSIDRAEDEGKSLAIDIKSHKSGIAEFSEQLAVTGDVGTMCQGALTNWTSTAKATKLSQDEHWSCVD